MQAKRLVVAALVCGFLVVCALAARVEAVPKSISIGGGTTADKPQSKLWYHDGTWWAILPDGNDLYFYRMEDGSFVKKLFPSSPGPVWVDSSNSARADVLKSGDTLFALVYKGNTNILYKYTYDSENKKYDRTSGFPTAGVSLSFTVGIINGQCQAGGASGSETATIAQDSTGKLWITYETTDKTVTPNVNKIRVIWSTSADHTQWDTCGHFLYPVPPSTVGVKADDISAMVAFDGKIGVLWSNQTTTGNDRNNFGFITHEDTQTDPKIWGQAEWLLPQPAPSGSSDDHIHLTVSSFQDVIAVTKATSGDILKVFIFWDGTTNWDGPYQVNTINGTRPIVLHEEDNDEVYVFYTDWDTAHPYDPIVYKKAKVDRSQQQLGAFSPAITVMRVSDRDLNDVTSTKDVVDAESGLVVVANNYSAPRDAYYTSIVMHAETQTGGSTGSDTVATNTNLTGKSGHLYLAAIATSPPRAVTAVQGLGLTNWAQEAVQCSGEGQTQVAV